MNEEIKISNIEKSHNIVDFLSIGTSIIMCLEASYQSDLGKKVLMVDKSSSLGGAWKSIKIDGISHVENAIHYFMPDKIGISYLTEDLKWPIEISQKKFRYFNFFNLFFFKFEYSSVVGRLIDKLIYQKKPSTFFNVINERGERSYYIANGSSGMTKRVKKMLEDRNIDIYLDSEITEIFFDKANKIVISKVGNKTIYSRSLMIGHGARLPKITHTDGTFKIKEKFYPRPAYHLVVHDQRPADVYEAILTSDPLVKYVHDVSRFSSLNETSDNSKKVFVFGLQSDVLDHAKLKNQLFKKLKDIKIISKDSEIIDSLYSEVILPTLDDNDLYLLKEEFGDMVNVLRTENFSNGIGYYAERWKSAQKS
mgnify:CR=1 FL=1